MGVNSQGDDEGTGSRIPAHERRRLVQAESVAATSATYTCELLFHDQGGTEAQIMKDGELMYGRRFEEGWQTLQWAEVEKAYIEKSVD